VSSRYKVHDDQVPHFVTMTVVNWIDALSRPEYKDIVLDSLQYCIEKKGLVLYAWVIMSNHLHLIVSATPGNKVGDIVRDFKKYTSKKLLEAIAGNSSESRKEWLMNAFSFAGQINSSNDNYQFWQQDYHPIELSKAGILSQRLNYLHENPVKAGLVWEAQHYKYSSATDYYENRKGLLPVTLL
jgi:REP element-mobilizing transposase RayT